MSAVSALSAVSAMSAASPECCSSKLIKDCRVAGWIVIIAVSLSAHPQVVQVHGVEADNSWQELVEGDVLEGRPHDPPALLVQPLVAPVRVNLQR